jgi:hypothetical protein
MEVVSGAAIEGVEQHQLVDILGKNSKPRRILANKLMESIGIELGKDRVISRIILENKMAALTPELVRMIAIEWNKKNKTHPKTLKAMLDFVNPVLDIYGLKLVASDKHSKNFKVEWILKGICSIGNVPCWNGQFMAPAIEL